MGIALRSQAFVHAYLRIEGLWIKRCFRPDTPG